MSPMFYLQYVSGDLQYVPGDKLPKLITSIYAYNMSRETYNMFLETKFPANSWKLAGNFVYGAIL